MEEGNFSKKLKKTIARQMIFGAIDEVATNWVMKEHKYALTPLAKDIHEIMLTGLRA